MKLKLLCPFVLLILVQAFSCSKDESAPPITQENTFSCRVNGKLFVPKSHGGFPTLSRAIVVSLNDFKDWTIIMGNGDDEIYLHIVGVDHTGNYIIGLSDGDADFYLETKNVVEFDFDPPKLGTTHISTTRSGELKVLDLDFGKRIVLKFDKLVLQDKDDPGETLELTKGKLNINLETLNKEEE